MTRSPLNLVFAKERSFSQKLNAAFAFVGHNARTLIPNLIIIPGPFSLLAGIGYGLYQSQIFGPAFSHTGGSPFEGAELPYLMLALGLMLLGSLLSFALASATVFLHIEAHITTGSGMVPLKAMWPKAWKSFGRIFGFSLAFSFLIWFILIVSFVPAAVLVSLVPALGGILMFFMGIGLLILLPAFSIGFPIYWFERKNVFTTLGRLVRLHTNWRWFSTAGLIWVLGLLAGTMSVLFAIPTYALLVYKAIHSVSEAENLTAAADPSWFSYSLMLASIILYLGQMACYSIIFLGASLQYFNLVEKLEARGLMERINEFGKQPA